MGCSQSTEVVSTAPNTTTKSNAIPTNTTACTSKASSSPNPPKEQHTAPSKGTNKPSTPTPSATASKSLPPLHSPSTPSNSTTLTTPKAATTIPLTSVGSDASSKDYAPGYASGASTPADSRSLDGSTHNGMNSSQWRSTTLGHSSSVLGLDSMIESRKEEGDLKSNVVHIEVPFGKPIEEVYDGVHNGHVLGSGISGLVRLVVHKATGIKYAVKCLDLGLVETEEGLQQLREEIFIMCQLDHPNIVRLEEVYESHSEIYLVQELCTGGELFDRLDEQPDYHYTEAECARLVKNMLCAVRYLHSKGIIHRDLKLENFLFSSRNPDSELKMIDFGLSKHFKYGEVHHEAVGTPYSVAPEVIRGCYDERCDIWAIGVITFLLLSGDPPFGGCGGPEPLMQVRKNILEAAFEFEPADIWALVSPAAREFITNLLIVDPKLRPTAKEAQKHHWLIEWAKNQKGKEGDKLNPNVVRALVNFKEYSDMRKLLCEVLSFTLLPDQIKDLRQEFEKMDTDGSGEISLAALKQVLLTNAGSGALGALTEKEVEDIFNAMRVRKSETRIHWHEFIAAGLSQCQVDDRNLRLAFDRLDSDHKGYITFEDVMEIMGNDAYQSEDAMRNMWKDSLKATNGHQARITYDGFLLLMKGQTLEQGGTERRLSMSGRLDPLPEVNESVMSTSQSHEDEDKDAGEMKTSNKASAGVKATDLFRRHSSGSIKSGRGGSLNPITPPMTPKFAGVMGDIDAMDEMPLTMDDDDDIMAPRSFTPPESPRRGAADFISPDLEKTAFASGSPLLSKLSNIAPIPELPPRPGPYGGRRRSRSVDDNDPTNNTRSNSDLDPAAIPADASRAMLMPEHEHNNPKFDKVIADETKTPLVVNRQLYRAHRTMRLSVLEATKRFEEKQTRRAQEILAAEPSKVGAGLVLRHGIKKKQVSSEAIRVWLKKSQEETKALVEKANRRGGRGRSRRQKTKSDMSGMLLGSNLSGVGIAAPSGGAAAGPGQPALASSATSGGTKRVQIHEPISSSAANPLGGLRDRPSDRSPIRGKSENKLQTSNVVCDDEFPSIRHATVPGEFRKTHDPFSHL